MRSGIIANLLKKFVHGIQIGLAIGFERISMAGVRHYQQLFLRMWRSVEHPFGDFCRHPAIFRACNEQDWNLKTANCRLDIAFLGIEPQTH
jgi:hypothetical protein